MQNKKNFMIDTSVLLDSPQNIIHLYQNGSNSVFISDIVIKELNGHKEDGVNQKGFYAREFGRAIDAGRSIEIDFEKISPKDGDYVTLFKCKFKNSDEIIPVQVISRDSYNDKSNSNDLKIIEISKAYGLELITNDLYLGLEAETQSIQYSQLRRDKVESPEQIKFDEEVTLKKVVSKEELLKILDKRFKDFNPWLQITIKYEDSNNIDYYLITENEDPKYRYKELDAKEIEKLYPVNPINSEQKFYAEMISSYSFEMGVVTGSTGSGKTLLAVQEGVRRVRDKNSSIDGIVYLRNTVTANDKESELGFRKGDQNQKLGYFAYPLFGAINFILSKGKRGKKQIDGTEKEEKTEEFMEKHNIEVIDIAHARGITISDKWIIFDELQNSSNETLKLIGTRVGKGSKLIMLGDFKQVDHPYLTKNRNALVSMLKTAKETGDIPAIQLRKTIRSNISRWFDKNI